MPIGMEVVLSTPAELLCSYDLRGNLIEVHALEPVLGQPREELLAKNLSGLLEPESWSATLRDILEHVGGAHPAPFEITTRSAPGDLVKLHVFTRLVFEQGRPVAIQAYGKELGEMGQSKSECAEKELTSTRNRLTQFSRQLKQLHRLSTTHYESLDDVFEDFLKTGCEVFQLPFGTILQANGGEGLLIASHGDSPLLTPGAHISLERTHFASQTGRLRTVAGRAGTASGNFLPEFEISLATPILVDSELYGTLCFSAPEDGSLERWFGDGPRHLIELMAGSLARLILEQRVQDERRSAERLERQRNRVLEMMAENRPLPETLGQLAGLVEDQFPGTTCAILTAENGFLKSPAASRLPAPFASALRDHRVPLGVNPLSAAAFGFASEFGLEFATANPIMSSTGHLLGGVVLFEQLPDVKRPHCLETLRVASRLAGIAIEQRELTDRLAFQAKHDFLTGLPNRLRLMELLEQRLTHAQINRVMVAVLFLDLDRFKPINDSLGHSVGDRLLIEVAERLKSVLPSPDHIAGRMGGDEFAMVLSAVEDEETAFRFGAEVLTALATPYLIDGRELFVTASIGVSFFPKDGDAASLLLNKADAAMYWAKNEGKNTVKCFFSGATQQGGIERLELENALRRAVEKGELELLFQPIVTMAGALDGLEVLLTWNHSKIGRVSPQQFIPMAEETGLIVPIGAWVLRESCQRAAQWLKSGLTLKRIAVNVSALQFARPDFVETVAAALAATGFPPAMLELELTESLVLQDITDSIHRMTQLRDLGVTMAIDDFGTGYSSLNYLRRLPVNELKIDQSFLRDLRSTSGTLHVVETIVSLAHQMKLSVVAEGVETIEQLELLRAAGCDRIQGHLYGMSLNAADAEALLARPDGLVPMRPQ